jgi:lipoprotein NlpD
VQRGDTLYAVAFANSLDYRDIASWNRLESPDRILVGQALRLTPPPGAVEVKPLDEVPEPSARPLQIHPCSTAGGLASVFRGQLGAGISPPGGCGCACPGGRCLCLRRLWRQPRPPPPLSQLAKASRPACWSGASARGGKGIDIVGRVTPRSWRWPRQGGVAATCGGTGGC